MSIKKEMRRKLGLYLKTLDMADLSVVNNIEDEDLKLQVMYVHSRSETDPYENIEFLDQLVSETKKRNDLF